MLKKAEDHVASLLLKMEEANANLQQPEQKDLLDCEADCEEIWRGEIQSDLVSTYFESCLKSLVDEVNVLITGLVDSGNKLALEEDLESILWKHTVETCIFLEVVEGGANDWVDKCQQAIDKSVQKEVSVHKLTCNWTNSRICVVCGICVSAIQFQLF